MIRKLFTLAFFGIALISSQLIAKQEPEKITVILDWFENPNHAILTVANKCHFFKHHNIEVEIIAPANAADPLKMIATKKADVAIYYQPQVVLHIAKGLPLMRIGTIINTPLAGLSIAKDSGIQTLKDLKGKRLGRAISSKSIIVSTMLENSGLKMTDVNSINVGFSLTSGLASKKLDSIAVMVNYEPFVLEKLGCPVNTFRCDHHGVPSYDELILVAHKDLPKRETLHRFILALNMAATVIRDNKERAWKLIQSGHPNFKGKLYDDCWKSTCESLPHNVGAFDPKRYDAFTQFMLKKGFIEKNIPVSDIAINLAA